MDMVVTGVAGFIGSHLAERLINEGYSVLGIDCFTDYYSREIKEGNIEWLKKQSGFKLAEEDLAEINWDDYLTADTNCIFHQAAQAGVRKSWGSSFDIYTHCNIKATQRLLESLKDKTNIKLIYASTSSVYGNCELPMTEDKRLRPVSPYGVTKLAAENLCHLYHENYGVPYISLRYFTVYGPRQRPDMAFHKFIKAILTGEEIAIFGDGEQSRDFTYIDDIVEANLLAYNSNINGEIFNVGGGSRVSVNEVIKKLESISGRKARVKYIEKQKGDAKHTYADLTKVKRELWYTPKNLLMKGLEKEFGWVEEKLKEGKLG